MSDEHTGEKRDGLRTGLCGCSKCRGGARPEEYDLAGREAMRLVDEAIKSMPERLGAPQDKRTWAGMVLGVGLATIERQNLDALIEAGDDPVEALAQILIQVVNALGKDLAGYLHGKDASFVPPQLALVRVPSLADILRGAMDEGDGHPDGGTRKLH